MMNEMSSRENTRCNGPSVVARLMGLDTLPPETRPTTSVMECFDESLRQHSSVTLCESSKLDLDLFPSTSFKQSIDNWNKKHSRLLTKCQIFARPFQREHPQEEQLQKFKKDFEAWQQTKLWEFSANLGQSNRSRLKNEQIFALETLNKEKIAVYMKKYNSVNNRFHVSQPDNNSDKELKPQTKDDMVVMRKLANKYSEPASRDKFHEKSTHCSPSRIVILKSFSDMDDEMEVPMGLSPDVVERDSCIEDILEEVRERLRLELEGKGRNYSSSRSTATHTSSDLQEGLTDPKQKTYEVVKHIKENITADLGSTLGTSESMRSYNNDSYFDEKEFSASIKRDARKFIIGKLKNVFEADTELESPMLDDRRGGNFFSAKEKPFSTTIASLSKGKRDTRFRDHKKVVNESFPKHFTHEHESESVDSQALSPPNFVRSFSAPASKSDFKKALLKDHHAKGNQIQQHEASKNDPATVDKSKRDGFRIKDRVLSLSRTLGMKGNFFGKKASSLQKSTIDTVHYMNPNQTMSFVARNFYIIQDNSTEVPPSPASFPCSPNSEHHSPVSPLDGPFVEYHSSTQVSGELNKILPESQTQTEEPASEVYGRNDIILMERHEEEEAAESTDLILIQDHGEAYVRDILLLSGLYHSPPLDQAMSRLDGQIKLVPSFVFDKVEESYRKHGKISDEDRSVVTLGDIIIERKMLFDLVNQALTNIIVAPITWEKWTHCLTPLPHGRKLLADLLHQIQMHANPQIYQPPSLENIVAWDVKIMPFSNEFCRDISYVATEFEQVMIGDLIDELLLDLSI